MAISLFSANYIFCFFSIIYLKEDSNLSCVFQLRIIVNQTWKDKLSSENPQPTALDPVDKTISYVNIHEASICKTSADSLPAPRLDYTGTHRSAQQRTTNILGLGSLVVCTD